MAMTIENVIAGLQADVDAGYFKMDDVLVIDWFSFRDVQRAAGDMRDDDDVRMSDTKARAIWYRAVEQIDIELDSFDNELINEFIQKEVEKDGQ